MKELKEAWIHGRPNPARLQIREVNLLKKLHIFFLAFLIVVEAVLWGTGLNHIFRGFLAQNYLETIAGVFVCAWSSWEITKDLEKLP